MAVDQVRYDVRKIYREKIKNMSVKHLLKNFKLPSSINFEKVSENDNKGIFEFYPFERSVGQTIGNSLRRTLLSSIKSYAVSAVRISVFNNGSQHIISSEFENIEGVEEDTSTIIDSLKLLKFNFLDDSVLQHTIRAEFKGAKSFTAENFVQQGVQILNANQVLFTASQDMHIEIELNVEYGSGYLPAELLADNVQEHGTITVDVIFSPILNVSLKVENIRIGYRNDYEKVIISIETDGTLLPADALAYAAKILKEQLTILINFDENLIEQYNSEGEQEINDMKKLLELSTEELELSSRSSNCLRAANIKTIQELVSLTEKEIANLPNFGAKSMDEIKQKLQDMELFLGMPLPEELSKNE